jgi:hypothetical protein
MRNLTAIRAIRAICGPVAGLSAGYLALHWFPLHPPDPHAGGLYYDSLFLAPGLLALVRKPNAPYVLLATLIASALAWMWGGECERKADRSDRDSVEKDQ